MILFITRLAVTAWAILIFRVTLAPHIAIAGVQPDLMAGLVFYLTLARGPTTGILAGFVLGLLDDVDQVTGLGVSSLAWCTMAWATSAAREAIDTSDAIVSAALLLAAVLLAELIRGICLAGFDAGRLLVLCFRWALPTALYTGVATPLLAMAIRAMLREKRWLRV